jgi:hypothetical protein
MNLEGAKNRDAQRWFDRVVKSRLDKQQKVAKELWSDKHCSKDGTLMTWSSVVKDGVKCPVCGKYEFLGGMSK